MNVTVTVMQLESDWLLVRFDGAKPPANKRAFWLNRALIDWLSAHPRYILARTLPILQDGELLAVHAWLGSASPAVPMRTFPTRVEKGVFESVPKEHLEAFLQEVYEAYFGRPSISSLAVVSRRGHVAVFDHVAERLLLIAIEDLRADDPTMQRIKKWLAAPDSHCLVVNIDPPGLKDRPKNNFGV